MNGKPITPAAWEKVSATYFEDGDTVTVKRADGSLINCRVNGIDAPETPKPKKGMPGQPYGEEAKQVLTGLLKDKDIDLNIPTDRETFKRKICNLATNGESVSKNMVKLGAAFADDFNGGNPELIAEEALAKAKKLGLFKKSNSPEKPKAYRDRYEK